MPKRSHVKISTNMKVASSPIIFVTRIWGLFPFTISSKDTSLSLEWSKKYAVYSFILGSGLVILTIRGIVDDLLAGSAKSVRMKQQTGKYITTGDISIVALIVLTGVYGIPLRVSNFFSYVDCLNEVDSIIVVNDAKQARKVSVIRLCFVLLIATVILSADLIMWWTIGGRSKESDFLVGNYIPFYVSYYVILMLQCQYWHLVYCVQRRLELINQCLVMDCFTTDDVIKSVENKAFSIYKTNSNKCQQKTLTPKSVGHIMNVLGRSQRLIDIFFIKNASKVRGLCTNDYITKLIRAYLKLCDAADCINKCCGFSVLIILASCLLHLVVTPYFLVLEVIGRQNYLFATLQLVWLAAHIGRLCMIVEACYACTVEVDSCTTKGLLMSLTDMASTALTYEDLRKQARVLENIIDVKLVAFSKLGAGLNTPKHNHGTTSDTVPLLSEEDTFEAMALEIEQLLKKLSQINERMTEQPVSGAAMLHTLQRHRDILADMSRDYNKINTQHVARREREELLKSNTDTFRPEGINRRDQYLKENAHIHNSDRLVNEQIAIAMETRDHLVNQRQTFKKLQTRFNDISNRFPVLNSLIQRINLRKRRDSLILGLVVAFCTFLLLFYAFH